MKQLTLERFAYTPMGTFGRLRLGKEFLCYTLEEVWSNNRPSIHGVQDGSCIPIGLYVLKRDNFPRHGNCFEVTGVPGRSFILIHKGNTILDIEGCIIPGDKLGWFAERWAIAPGTSGPAYDRLMKRLEGEDTALLSVVNDLNQGVVV